MNLVSSVENQEWNFFAKLEVTSAFLLPSALHLEQLFGKTKMLDLGGF